MLTITTQSTKTALTTVARVKAQGQILGTDDDALLTVLVNRATATIERFCARVFHWRTVVESVPSCGGAELLVSCRPVGEVTGLDFQTQEQDISDLLTIDPEAGILFRPQGFVSTATIERFIAQQPSPYYRAPDWVVHYTGGYVCYWPVDPDEAPEGEPVPPEGTPALPEDLIGIATDLVIIMYDDRKRNGLRTSESEGDASADYRTLGAWLEERCAFLRNVVL